jgi:hypothetical protein
MSNTFTSYIPSILVNVVVENETLSEREFAVVRETVNPQLFRLPQPRLMNLYDSKRGTTRVCNIQFLVHTQNYKNNASRKEVEQMVRDLWNKEVDKLKKDRVLLT